MDSEAYSEGLRGLSPSPPWTSEIYWFQDVFRPQRQLSPLWKEKKNLNPTPNKFMDMPLKKLDRLYILCISRVVNRFCKRSLNDRFVFGKKRSFLKPTHSFRTFRKRIAIVFIKTICNRFLYDCFLKNDRFR